MGAMKFRSLLGLRSAAVDEAPSLYDVVSHPDALPQSLPRVEQVPAAEIVGTTRHPSRTGVDFLPPPELRTVHWRDDFRRVEAAFDQLLVLPPVELVKVGSCYFVRDGHKRVAAAKQRDAELDAIVIELRIPRQLHPSAG